jgi:phenylalanyl-tRNA synthetase beta chain
MKFTLNWLKEHLDTEASLAEIAETLTRVGLEVEEIIDPSERLKNFVVARVLEAEPHPNADKLRVCKVDAGRGAVQVVCGAPNARKGLLVVFAQPGTYVPGLDVTLGKASIRGVESLGMMCSERELELSQEHNGIIELPESAADHIGERFTTVMGLDDPVFHIKITPNRPDCLGVRGVARDLAAAGLGKLKSEDAGFSGEGDFASPVRIELKFARDAESACPIFVGRTIKGVKNQPSPAWLQQRLRAIGLRPINALVDVTNYISYDRARPLHVYDADKLKGAIHARLGAKGESFLALDGRSYEVDDAMCVIADDNGVLGLGGVMGGEATGCTEETTSVFIESAYFDPARTAKTGRRTGILSDARFRFERGIDPQSAPLGANLATQMILKICGGAVSRMAEAGKAPAPREPIAFNAGLARKLTGVQYKVAEIAGMLERLGFELSGKGPDYKVSAPSWRPDVHGAADLVEEIVRLKGVDSIPSTPLPRGLGVAKPVLTSGQKRVIRARRALASRGFVEAVTWSFISRSDAKVFGGGQDELELANPISTAMSSMRPSLLPGLLAAARDNRNRGFSDFALCEVGSAYKGERPEDQMTNAAGVRVGASGLAGGGRHWGGAASAADVFDVKADALAALAALGFDASKAQVVREAPGWFHPGRSGALKLGPKVTLGVFGELHPETLKALDVSGAAAGFELFLDAIPEARRKSTARQPLDAALLQTVTRDFAFVLDSGVAAADVVRAAQSAEKKLIANVVVFDLFEGKNLGEGKKSLAIEVTLQPREKTLTDEEIEAVAAKVAAEVKKATGGEIRG